MKCVTPVRHIDAVQLRTTLTSANAIQVESRPSLPRSTPGMSGMTSSYRLVALGALSMVEKPTDPEEDVSLGSIVMAEAVTSTDSTTASTCIRWRAEKAAPRQQAKQVALTDHARSSCDSHVTAGGDAGEAEDAEFVRFGSRLSGARLSLLRFGIRIHLGNRLQVDLRSGGAEPFRVRPHDHSLSDDRETVYLARRRPREQQQGGYQACYESNAHRQHPNQSD